LSLVADLTAPLSVRVVYPGVICRDDAHDIVGLGVRLAAAGGQSNTTDELPHLGRDDDLVADPEV
jgi:hypothetical protein